MNLPVKERFIYYVKLFEASVIESKHLAYPPPPTNPPLLLQNKWSEPRTGGKKIQLFRGSLEGFATHYNLVDKLGLELCQAQVWLGVEVEVTAR